MSRLHKKCFIASTGFHLLLAGLLIVGPGFLSPEPKTVHPPVINFVPFITVDEAISSDRGPKGPPPQAVAAPQLPAPVPPQQEQQVRSEPAPTAREIVTPKSPKDNSFAIDQNTKPRPRKIEINTKLVRKTDAHANAKTAATAREAAEARLAAQRAAQAISGMAGALSPSTEVNVGVGGSGGQGVPYANFNSAVQKVYYDAWLPPAGISDDHAVVVVSVTIARNGSVISSRIIEPCGTAAVNQSVQATLDRVRYVAPLPATEKRSERTVTLGFDLKAKLLG